MERGHISLWSLYMKSTLWGKEKRKDNQIMFGLDFAGVENDKLASLMNNGTYLES